MRRNRPIYGIVLGTVLLMLTAPAAEADGEDGATFLLRTTGIGVITDASSNSVAAGGLDLDLGDDLSVALDGTYFVTPHIGVNVLATFLNFEVSSAGTSQGSVDLLPPIVTVQYHFLPAAQVRPYVGVGFNYNHFSGESGTLSTSDIEVEDAVGFVGQAGLDYMINKSLSLGLNFKYLRVDTDVTVAGVDTDELDLNAFIIGVGIGYHF